MISASRTDRGVHATGAVVVVDVGEFWDVQILKSKLNKKLLPHVFITFVWRVDDAFHARFCATSRKYRYILSSKIISAFAGRYISEHRIGDFELFKSALGLFRGRHDFANFCKRSQSKSNVREIFSVRIYEREVLKHSCVIVSFTANAFLYAQIRLMIGAALACADSKISLFELQNSLLDPKSARLQFAPASPCGLYLCAISF